MGYSDYLQTVSDCQKKLTSKKNSRTISKGGLTNPILGINHMKPPCGCEYFLCCTTQKHEVAQTGPLKQFQIR